MTRNDAPASGAPKRFIDDPANARLLAHALEHSPSMVLVTDANGTIEYANRTLCGVSGYSLEELVGKNPRIFKSGRQPAELYAEMWNALKNGGEWRGEIDNRKKNGEIFRCSMRIASITDEAGAPRWFVQFAEDVTAQRLAQDALRDSEELYRTLTEQSFDAVAELDEHGLVAFANPRRAQMSGIDAEAALGKPLSFGTAPDDAPKVDAFVAALYAEPGVFRTLSYRRVKPDGGYTVLETSGKTVKDRKGRLRAVLSAQDVTKRSQDHDALKRSEQFSRLLLSSTGEALFGVDVAGLCTFVNPAALTLLGYDDEQELLGLKLHDYIHFAQDGRPCSAEDCRILLSMREGRGAVAENDLFRRKDGSIFPARYTSHPLLLDGVVLGAVVGFADVTEERRRENERLATIDRLERLRESLHRIVSHQGLKDDDFQGFQDFAARESAKALGVDRASLWLLDPDGERLRCLTLYEAHLDRTSRGVVLTRADAPRYFEALTGHRPIIAEDARSDPRTNEFFDFYLNPLGIGAMLDCPIHGAGRTRGVLCAEHVGARRVWNDDEIAFAQATAELVGQAVQAEETARTRRELERREREFTLIFEQADDAVVWASADTGRIVKCNHAAETLFGLPREKLIGMHQAKLHPPETFDHYITVFKDIVGKKARGRIEAEIQGALGRITPVEIVFSTTDVGGESVVQGVFRDISERLESMGALKRSEAKFRRLVENLSKEYFLYSRSSTGYIEYISPSVKAVLGFAPDEMLGRIADLPPGEPRTALARPLRRLAERPFKGAPQPPFELPVRCKDGSTRILEIVESPVFDEENALASIEGLARDVTLKRAAQEELLSAKEAAEAADRAKSEFLANMSHEIRTPLNGVLGMLQLVLGSNLDEEQKDYVQTAYTSGKNLLAIINDILDFSKIEAGRIEMLDEPFDPASLLDQALSLFGAQTKAKGIELRVKAEADLPSPLLGDAGRIRQILFNLVGNAVKFTDKGAVEARVELDRDFEGEGAVRLVFTVSDTGVGVPKDRQDMIFEPFTQVDGSHSRRFQGTGLGLSIVKRLVLLLGGSIAIDSEPGLGTTMRFTVILRQVDFNALESGRRDEAPELREPAGLRVLLVEDEPVNRAVVARLLQKRGHLVDAAENGLRALRAVSDNDYDVVLMDIQMPQMDGVEATRRIRAQTSLGPKSRIPIIAVTAHAMKGRREDFLAAGMDGYVVKPVDVHELVRALCEVLAAPKPTRESAPKKP